MTVVDNVDNVEKSSIGDEQKEAKLQYFGTGRRKTSTAKVKLIKGKGDIFVNSKPLTQYFTRECYQLILKRPLEVTELSDKFDVYISVSGGGTTGQVDAG